MQSVPSEQILHLADIPILASAVADRGFPVGGVDPLGGVGLQRGCFSVKMYVKTKELGPVGGVFAGHAPRSANALGTFQHHLNNGLQQTVRHHTLFFFL